MAQMIMVYGIPSKAIFRPVRCELRDGWQEEEEKWCKEISSSFFPGWSALQEAVKQEASVEGGEMCVCGPPCIV